MSTYAKSSHKERLMKEALEIINGARQKAYGPPERNFLRIAILWSAYLEVAMDAHGGITDLDVCHMLDLVKLARLIETPDHEDSIRDRFGYQGCYVDLVCGEWQEGQGAQGAPPFTPPHAPGECSPYVPWSETRGTGGGSGGYGQNAEGSSPGQHDPNIALGPLA